MFIPEAAPWETHVMVQMLCAGSVCGTVRSPTLLTGSELLPPGERRRDGRVPKNHLRAFALALSLSPMAVSEIEKKERRGRMEGKEEEGGGFVLALMRCTSRFRLQVSNRKAAIVAGPYLHPPPVDFTVNRASPLVTEGQCAPLPPFQPRRVRAARQFFFE